jgi:hypothetical protein
MQLAVAVAELHFQPNQKLFFEFTKGRKDFSLRLFYFF